MNNEKNATENWLRNITVAGGIIIFALMIYSTFVPVKHENITFNITGINSSETLLNDSVVYIHYDCIKFCSNRFYNDGAARKACYEQCNSLGKEKQ